MKSDIKRGGGASDLPSGRFVLRLPPILHRELRRAARRKGQSLNAYCIGKLSAPTTLWTDEASATLSRAAALFADDLVAAAVYGSWARAEVADTSDVDVVIVLADRVPIRRSLYRRWDEDPVAWAGRAVEPHLTHLPASGSVPTGLWAEVALDGIVLVDRQLRLSRCLIQIRRQLAEGGLERRWTHGQPYWLEVACNEEPRAGS